MPHLCPQPQHAALEVSVFLYHLSPWFFVKTAVKALRKGKRSLIVTKSLSQALGLALGARTLSLPVGHQPRWEADLQLEGGWGKTTSLEHSRRGGERAETEGWRLPWGKADTIPNLFTK